MMMRRGWSGIGGVVEARVGPSECGDRIDRVMGSIFGVGRKSPPEKFFGGGGGGGGRQLAKNGERGREDGEYFAFVRHLDELHVTWAHLEKKQTRLQTNTKTLEDLCSQGLETASQAIHDAVTTHQVMSSHYSMTASARTDSNADLEDSSYDGVTTKTQRRRVSIFSSCYLFRNPFSSTTMGDENHIRTLGDYSKRASNWLERLLAGSISTWEDLTTPFLAQFFPTGRIKGMHVFVGNFTYVVDFMIVEDISSIIDPRLSQVLLGRPFIEISNMTHDPPEGVVRFIRGVDEVAYKMPHKIKQYDSPSDLEKE
ncbi:hypothetical protein Tco_1517457 [Tanacetum coccineum]